MMSKQDKCYWDLSSSLRRLSTSFPAGNPSSSFSSRCQSLLMLVSQDETAERAELQAPPVIVSSFAYDKFFIDNLSEFDANSAAYAS